MTIPTTSKYKYSKTEQTLEQRTVTLLSVSPQPDWEDFTEFVSEFVDQEHGRIIEQDYGMDRHQIRYDVGNVRYILQYEHYSESIWVEQELESYYSETGCDADPDISY